MLTIVQECTAKACDGRVRFTRVWRLLDNYLVGHCDECGRTYRMYNGHPAASAPRRTGLRALGNRWSGGMGRTA